MIDNNTLDKKQADVLSQMTLIQLIEGLNRLERLLGSQLWDKTTEQGMIKAKTKIEKEIEKRT